MQQLIEYVREHSERGACQCGKCFDAPANPETRQPIGHTADMIFFKVAAKNNPTADEFKALIDAAGQHGTFCEMNPLDGNEHNYMEVGGWIGDQGLALTFIGLGAVLGAWKLLTPLTMLGADCPPDLVQQMAGMGMVAIQSASAVSGDNNDPSIVAS